MANFKTFTAKQVERMVRLYTEGNGLAYLAEEFDSAIQTIRRVLTDAGVTIRPRGRIAA